MISSLTFVLLSSIASFRYLAASGVRYELLEYLFVFYAIVSLSYFFLSSFYLIYSLLSRFLNWSPLFWNLSNMLFASWKPLSSFWALAPSYSLNSYFKSSSSSRSASCVHLTIQFASFSFSLFWCTTFSSSFAYSIKGLIFSSTAYVT